MIRQLGNYRIVIGQLALLACCLVAWQLGADHDVLNPLAFSEPSAIFESLTRWVADGSLAGHVFGTIRVLTVGYLLGLAGGLALGVGVALSPVMKAYLGPFIVFGNAMPRIILVPFLIAWLGFGDLPKIILVFLVIVFVVTVTIEQGILSVRGDIVANARILGAGRFALFRDVYFPGVMLWTVISARLCIGYALQAAILAEFFGAVRGLGYLIVESQEAYDTSGIYAALFVTMTIAAIIDRILAKIEARATKWLPESE